MVDSRRRRAVAVIIVSVLLVRRKHKKEKEWALKFWDLIKMSCSNLWRRKLRTFLTILGVVIGTASIVVGGIPWDSD